MTGECAAERTILKEVAVTTTHAVRWTQVPTHFVLVAVVLAGAAGLAVGRGIDHEVDRPAQPAPPAAIAAAPGAPVVVQAQAQRDVRRIAEQMPSGWPATEAMLNAPERPLGTPAQRVQWSRDADLMPAGWPATAAMR